jgi:hypothetical protein
MTLLPPPAPRSRGAGVVTLKTLFSFERNNMRIVRIDAPDEGKDAVKWTFKEDEVTRKWYSVYNTNEELVGFSFIQGKIELARENNWRVVEETIDAQFRVTQTKRMT